MIQMKTISSGDLRAHGIFSEPFSKNELIAAAVLERLGITYTPTSHSGISGDIP